MTTPQPLTFQHINAKDAFRLKSLYEEKQQNREKQFENVQRLPEFLTHRICHKSGKLINKYDYCELVTCLAAIGFERTIVVLSKQAIHHTAPEWLYTDPIGLEQLSVADPIGYYIFCLTKTQWTREQQRSPKPEDIWTLYETRREIENKLSNQELSIKQIIATNDVSRLRLSVAEKASDLQDIEKVDTTTLTDPVAIYTTVMNNFNTWLAAQRRNHNLPKKKKTHNPYNSNVSIQAINSIRHKVAGYGGFQKQKRASQSRDTWTADMYMLANDLDEILTYDDVEELKYRMKRKTDKERKEKEERLDKLSKSHTKSGKPIYNPKIKFSFASKT